MNPLVTSLIASSRHRLAPYPRFSIPLASNATPSNNDITYTFARNSTATYIDANVVLQTAAIDVPRFQNGKYLVEPDAANLFLQSGTPATQTITVVSGNDYTVQCYGSGSVTLSVAGTGTAVQGTPVTFTATSTTLVCTVTGLLSRAQVELGNKATSYIPTTSSAVTRAADVLHYDVGSAITQGQGSLYCEFWDGNTPGTIRRILNISDNTANNRISIYIDTVDKLKIYSKDAGIVQIDSSAFTLLSGLNKVLFGYVIDSAKLYLNGSAVYTEPVCTISTNFTKLNVGCFHDGTGQLNGEIGNVKYFKEVITEAEAIKLTTI